jgi:hypothetical protein
MGSVGRNNYKLIIKTKQICLVFSCIYLTFSSLRVIINYKVEKEKQNQEANMKKPKLTPEKLHNHLRTVCIHKYYVFAGCRKAGIPLRGLLHDLSKLSPVEFFDSARYWSGTGSPIDAQKKVEGYSRAWLHHKSLNKSHWEYWVDWEKGQPVPRKMEGKYLVESMADLVGSSKAYSGEGWHPGLAVDYYREHSKNWIQHPDTAQLKEYIIGTLEVMGERAFFVLLKAIVKQTKKNKFNYGGE